MNKSIFLYINDGEFSTKSILSWAKRLGVQAYKTGLKYVNESGKFMISST